MLKENVATELQIGDCAVVSIDGYTHDGRGVARVGGRVVFIGGAVRGEQLEVEITACRKKIFSGEIVRILTPSPERMEPLCPVYAACGGCQMQHISYAEELSFKQGQVEAALRRIGGLPEVALRPIIGADEQLHYRNKGVFHVSRGQDGARLGFWDEGTHSPAGECCRLLFPRELVQVAEWLQGTELPPNVTDVILRRSDCCGALILALKLADDDRAAVQPLLAAAREHFTDIAVTATETLRGWQVHTGEQTITDALGGTKYRISPPSFFQVNNRQTERLLDVAAELLGDCRVLVDAYCGIGTIGLYLAAKMSSLTRLVGIEINESAVENARANAVLNGIANAEFFAGKAEALFERVLPEQKPDAVIVDPPRRGCHNDLLDGLLRLGAPRVLYVSCNPATLARDLARLTDGGYRVEVVQPVDMFPRTHHVETVVLLADYSSSNAPV